MSETRVNSCALQLCTECRLLGLLLTVQQSKKVDPLARVYGAVIPDTRAVVGVVSPL
jgi:hypothetical protein